MAKQFTNREKLALQLDHLSESELEEIVEYVSIMETMRRDHRQPDTADDDLMESLSSAYENRRARQAYEWESARQQANASPPRVRAAHR